MKASVLHKFGTPPTFEKIADPVCGPNSVVIELKACGVCRSDYHAWLGSDPDVKLPHIMGHELAGIIAETGSGIKRFAVGDYVTVPFILGCGICSDCQTGNSTICDNQETIGFTVSGGFAQFVEIYFADFNLVRLPCSLGFETAAAMGCRVTTAFRALTDRACLLPGEWLAVYGCGGIGTSAILIAKALGAKVIGIDINTLALEKARNLGADIVLDSAKFPNIWQEVRELTNGGVHVSLDALGIEETFQNSIRSLRKLGRHIQVGMPTGNNANVSLALLDLIYSRQLKVIGTRGMASSGFSSLLTMIDEGSVKIDSLISKNLKLSQVSEALSQFGKRSEAGITIINNFSM